MPGFGCSRFRAAGLTGGVGGVEDSGVQWL